MERNEFTQTSITTDATFAIQKLSLLHITYSSDIFVGILQRSPNLVELRVMHSSFDDRCCAALVSCPKLEVLNLMSTKITSAGTDYISDRFFVVLILSGLVHIALLSNLRRLSVRYTQVGDEGIMHLTPILPQLTLLDCSKCPSVRESIVPIARTNCILDVR